MTTENENYYLVAYPHPSIPPSVSVLPFKLVSKTFKSGLLEKLADRYPKHSPDLKDRGTTIWKAQGLTADDVDNPSKKLVYKWINERQEKGEEMKAHEDLGTYFPEGPADIAEEQVHLVVVTQEILDDIDLQGDTEGNQQLMNVRRGSSRTIGGVASPSDCVKSISNVRETVTSARGPRYGRPSDRFGPPTALFSNPLAILRYNLEHLDGLTPDLEMITPAFDFVTAGAEFFDDEAKRGKVLQNILKNLLERDAQWQKPIEDWTAKPYGAWFEGFFAYLIFEMKNEPGLGGDPFLQALAVYSKIIQQKKYAEFVMRSNLPIVLLSMAGNCLTVSTAIYTDAVYADKLLSIDLHLGSHGSDNVLRVARIFHAINECTGLLRKLYRGVVLSDIRSEVMYPNPTADPPDVEIPQLKFFAKLDRVCGTPLVTINPDDERHALYLARMPGIERDVLVKFAVRYNERAHRLLAECDPPLAPTLHYCIPVIGGLKMVVMDYVSDSSPLPRFFVPPALPRSIDAQVVKKGLTEALRLLHEKDLVFGDLRTLNILYSHESDRIFLVDFDWVGKHGEDRYSTCLNPEVNPRVTRWGVMKKSDDEESLDDVMNWLSRQDPLEPSKK